MSLFPAFADENEEKQQETIKTNDGNWLTNSSFQPDILTLTLNDATEKKSESVGKPKEKVKKHKKSKLVKPDDVSVNSPTISEVFRIDKTRTKEFFNVDTISRPSVPKYDKKYSIFKRYKSKNKKFKRYFKVKWDVEEIKDDVIKKSDLVKKIDVVKDGNFAGFKEETNLSKTTEEFNRKLAENPQDVQTWLEYVKFQDSVYEFEKNYKKGSIAKGNRVTADRKLSILDKALSHLPNNETLLRERLNICVNTFPSDELYIHLEKLVEKEQSNIILWQGYIESRQCSMSHCNTPTVLKLYTKCLSTLHQLRRTAKIEKSVLEENILRMLYQCGLFLKQSGLFELLWTLLKMYLDLNLSHQERNCTFNTLNDINKEEELVKLEEVILNSQLPLHELWLRIEKLREACHWLPYNGERDCEDPQRLVFPQDVSELIHPITMPGNTFKMTATILTLLKVPLLPCRHTTMKNFGLDYVPWALDSIESILPIFFRTHFIDLSSQHFLNYTQKLTVGPQYLKPFPGQEDYLIFILEIMSKCTESLDGLEKTAVSVWLLRLHRTFGILEKNGLVKMTKALQKKLKSDRKNLLKSSGNNIVLYIEYSLIEIDLNDNLDSAINILMTTLKMQQHQRAVDTITDRYLKTSLCAAYKTLIELYFKENNREKTIEFGLRLALGISIDRNIGTSESSINEATLKFKHVTLKLLQENCDDTNVNVTQTVEHFLPNFFIDWITSHIIFMYHTKGFKEAIEFLEENVLNNVHESKVFEREILSEFYVSLLFNERLKTPSVENVKHLEKVLYKSIEMYPNNMFFLAILSKVESISCSIGKSFWKLKSLLMKTGHALPNLFLVFIEMQRVNIIQETWIDPYTGNHMSMDSGMRNKTLALFRSLVAPGMCTRRCGLIWRLYLQFLYENFDAKLCRNVYYSAVEECPWLKALYIDAAIYIPTELPQIQDLLIEKQLRLHVTPDELDILRN